MSGGNSLDLEQVFQGKEPMAAEIGNTYMEWTAAKQTAMMRWRETSEFLYATSTRETVNGNVGGLSTQSEDESGQAGWNHSTHIPKLTEIFDNLSAVYLEAIYPMEEFFEFVGNDAPSSNKQLRAKLKHYLVTKHKLQRLRVLVQRLVQDYVQYGNAFCGVEFVRETINITVDEKPYTTGYIGPKVYRISPYDIVFNPLATSFEESPKIVRSIKTLGELHREVEDCTDNSYRKEALDRAMECRSAIKHIGVQDFDKHFQMQYDGYGTASQYFGSGHVEILHFYGDIYDIHEKKFYKNYVISVIDRMFVLRAEPLKTWDGRPYLFHAGWRGRADNLWAMGPLDNLVGMQYLINHLENARADAFDQMIEPTRIEVGDVERVDVTPGRPGGTYRIPGGEGSVSNLAPDTTILNADNQIQFKMQQMEEFAGLPREQLGIRTPGEKTLGEVAMLDNKANKIFKNKVYQLEEMMEKILNAELELARLNPDVQDLIAVVGQDGITEFVNITRDDLKSNGRIIPLGAKHFERKQKAVSNFQLLQQGLAQDELAMQHVSSIQTAQIYADLMDLGGPSGVVSPFVRVGEMAKLSKLQNAAQTQVQTEDNVDIGGEGMDE